MAHSLLFTAMIIGGIVMALAVIGSTILIALKVWRGGLSRKDQGFQNEEARMIQEIYRGLSRMEERVEALETIILERERKDEGK